MHGGGYVLKIVIYDVKVVDDVKKDSIITGAEGPDRLDHISIYINVFGASIN